MEAFCSRLFQEDHQRTPQAGGNHPGGVFAEGAGAPRIATTEALTPRMELRHGRRALPIVFLVSALTCGACGDDGAPAADAGTGMVHPRFDPVADPMPFGAVPWPDDLYLGAGGRIDVALLPGELATPVPEYHEALRETLRDLSGFGAVSPVFFYFDGPIDETSLPSTPAASVRDGASVFLVDVDPGSPSAFMRVPARYDVEEVTDPSTGTGTIWQLAVRPDDGHPLAEGRKYAAVLTSALRDATGASIAPDPDFAVVRDAATRPGDPLLAEAHDRYAPVLDSLDDRGVARAHVVGLAVFGVQNVTGELRDARARVWELAPPVVTLTEVIAAGPDLDARLGAPAMDVPGLDVEGGVAHGSIGFLVHGSFESPWLLSDLEHVHGRFRRGPDGRLSVGRFDRVPFTLVIPRSADVGALRVVVFQHGLGGERSSVMAFADALAGAGYAVLAIDAPFHGLRVPRATPDDANRFTGATEPDGFGDVTGGEVVADFAGILDGAGELVSFHPVYLRDTLRQSVVDLFATVRLVREPAAWDAVRAADPALAELGFAPSPIAFVGNSLGGIIGTMLTAMEPEIGASVLSVTGGYLVRMIVDSPPFNMGYLPQLFPLAGIDPSEIDYAAYHPVYRPEVAILQTLTDRGDAINYGNIIRGRGVDVLMLMALHDETVNNVATESLATTVAAPMIGAEPAHTSLATTVAPVRANATVDGASHTRALYVHAPATHGLMSSRTDVQEWAHPVAPPFEAVPERRVMNPIDAAVGQMLHFFESWRSGAAEIAPPPPM